MQNEGMESAPQSSAPPASVVIWHWRPGDGTSAAGAASRARRHGLVRGVVGLGVGALLVLWKPVLGAVAAGIALVLLILAVASPLGVYARVEGWITAFARGVGAVVSGITLGVLHLFVFTPLGLLLRATGRLRIERLPDPDVPSYWRAPDGAGRAHHDRQF